VGRSFPSHRATPARLQKTDVAHRLACAGDEGALEGLSVRIGRLGQSGTGLLSVQTLVVGRARGAFPAFALDDGILVLASAGDQGFLPSSRGRRADRLKVAAAGGIGGACVNELKRPGHGAE